MPVPARWRSGEPAGGLSAAERAELDQLRRENRELKQANEILRLSATVFTRDRPRGH